MLATMRQFWWLMLGTWSLGLIVFIAKGAPLEVLLLSAVVSVPGSALVALIVLGLRRPTLPPKE